MLDRDAGVVPRRRHLRVGQAVFQRRALTVPVGDDRQQLIAVRCVVREADVRLVAQVMPMQVVEAVEAEVAERERRDAILEPRRVRRIRDQIRRLLMRHGERVARALAHARCQLVVEVDAGDAVVSIEERIEIRAAEGGRSRRAVVLQLTAGDEAQRRRWAERDAGARRDRRVAERAVRLAVVRRDPGPAE